MNTNKRSIIYFYTSDRPANNAPRGIIKHQATNKFAREAPTDGMIHLWLELAALNIIDRVEIFIDSHIGCGVYTINPRATIWVVPNIDTARDFIKPDDMVIVRGGFKPWYQTLTAIYERRMNWILFYRANTNRNSWPFWDIILDDLIDESFIHLNRYWFAFSKPVNEDIFHYIPVKKKQYDACLGASHIHRKKGQFLAVRAVHEYRKLFERDLHCILPGGFIRCMHNTEILETIEKGGFPIEIVGHLPRALLCEKLNKCKMFIHAGPGGQNDRGVLEAMACGLPVILTSPSHFSPFVSSVKGYNSVSNPDSSTLANLINVLLKGEADPKDVAKWYLNNNGLAEVCIPKMKKLIYWMNRYDIPVRPQVKVPRTKIPWI